MAEENLEVSKEELLDAIDAPAVETPVVTLEGAELEASEMGWTPKEKWVENGHDPKDWRSAEVWLDRGRFFSTINSLKTELQDTKKQVAEAWKQGRDMATAKFQEEIAELKAERKEALSQGDLLKADDLQDAIEDKKQEAAKVVQQSKPVDFTPPPEHALFTQRNPWYEADEDLRGAADNVGFRYKMKNPKATPAELYFHVEETMRTKFSTQIKGGRQGPPVETGSTTRGSPPSSGDSLTSLKRAMTDFERNIMRNVIASTPDMDETKYLKEYAKVKDK